MCTSRTSIMPPQGAAVAETSRVKPLKLLVVDLLATHLDDLLDAAGDELHDALPVHVKATLMAVARRRSILTDDMFVALADASACSLDVSDSRVTDAGVLRAAEHGRLAGVRHADITSCDGITVKGLVTLSIAAPQLFTLRCGGCAPCDVVVAAALPFLLPKLPRRRITDVDDDNDNDDADDWESWESSCDGGDGKGEARSLRWMWWSGANTRMARWLEKSWPRLVLLPTQVRVAAEPDNQAFLEDDGDGGEDSSCRETRKYHARRRREAPRASRVEGTIAPTTFSFSPPPEMDTSRALDADAVAAMDDDTVWREVNDNVKNVQDDETVASVAESTLRWRLAFPEDDVPLSVRFKAAIDAVEVRRAEKRAKNARHRLNREARALSPSQRLMCVSLDDT